MSGSRETETMSNRSDEIVFSPTSDDEPSRPHYDDNDDDDMDADRRLRQQLHNRVEPGGSKQSTPGSTHSGAASLNRINTGTSLVNYVIGDDDADDDDEDDDNDVGDGDGDDVDGVGDEAHGDEESADGQNLLDGIAAGWNGFSGKKLLGGEKLISSTDQPTSEAEPSLATATTAETMTAGGPATDETTHPTERTSEETAPIYFESEQDQLIPAAPKGCCPSEMAQQVLLLQETLHKRSLSMSAVIQENKGFRNPSIYEKLIEHSGLDELGSNFSAHIFDPKAWGPESYYEELAKATNRELERQKKENKNKVDFVKEDEPAKKKSKWSDAPPLAQTHAPALHIPERRGPIVPPSNIIPAGNIRR